MKTHCLIIKFIRQTFSSTQKIKRRVCPIITCAYFGPRIALTFVRCSHCQQMLYSNIINCFFSSFHFIVREIIQNLVINTIYLSFINCNTNKQSHNTFGCGHYMDTIILFIIVPTIRIHFFTIFICNYLTYIWLVCFYKIV